LNEALAAFILGIVEGVTEFLPISSTGHMILAGDLMGLDAARWAQFTVVIQLGAILAVVALYWRTFWTVATGMLRREGGAWRFAINIALAFLPAAVIGLVFINQIEALLAAKRVVAWALIAGGVAILAIERLVKPSELRGVAAISPARSLAIGFLQCLAMIPGVSRSGATIMGALLLGVERRTAAEFSFFLAVPTMLGASTLELVKADTGAPGVGAGTIAIGFVVSFIVAMAVIRGFVALISRHGFGPFAWYRIVAGIAALWWLS
jgi:undecaprenyl-diphosphatase